MAEGARVREAAPSMNGGFLFVLVILFVFMYLLLIRPQRQQQRRQSELLASLKPGDEVITVGGIYGDITEVEDDRVSLEIAEDIEIEVAKRAIASVVPPEDALTAPEPEAAAESEAVAEPEAAAEPETAEEPVTAPEPEPLPGGEAQEDAGRR